MIIKKNTYLVNNNKNYDLNIKIKNRYKIKIF